MRVWHRVALATLVAGVLATDPLWAQQLEPRRWERRGFDFSPDGVWRRRARNVARLRREALERRDFSYLNRAIGAARARGPGGLLAAPAQLATFSSSAVTGTMYAPVLLVRYKNTDPATLPPASSYDAVLFGASPPAGYPYSVRTYYEEISSGLFTVRGTVVGWITLDSNEVWYTGTAGCNGLCSPPGSSRTGNLVREAVVHADSTVDMTQFDNDGPDGSPNSGDDDGVVDLVWLYHPTIGGECSLGANNNHMWAHRWVYEAWSGGLPLTTSDARQGGGQIRVSDYIIQSGVGGEACDSTALVAPGITAHELGHGLGLPDFYDTNPGDGDNSEGVGEWGLMASGPWARPKSPAHMESFSLAQLGWIGLRPVTTSGTQALAPIETGDTAIVVYPPASVPNPRGEYFLLENRQALESDTALIAKGPKAPGLLIWHVDPTKYNSGFPFNEVNSGPIHALWLMQADGLNQLRSSLQGFANRGDAGDPYPGSSGNTVFGYGTNPAARLNAPGGAFVGFQVDSIRQAVPNGAMMFRLVFAGLTVVRASDTTLAVRVRGSQYTVFRGVLQDGDTATIAADSAVSRNGGRTTLVFTAWSDAGARSHLHTGQVTGDTLIASYQVRHQVVVATVGTGTVGTSPSVPVSPGAFVDQGASLTLTATPGADQAFIGWSGDTSAMSPTLTLPMQRPYTLTATFVPLSTLIDQFLLGGSALTPSQIAALDLNGNHNSALDLGDLVAWLDKSGVQLSAGLMRRLLLRMVP